MYSHCLLFGLFLFLPRQLPVPKFLLTYLTCIGVFWIWKCNRNQSSSGVEKISVISPFSGKRTKHLGDAFCDFPPNQHPIKWKSTETSPTHRGWEVPTKYESHLIVSFSQKKILLAQAVRPDFFILIIRSVIRLAERLKYWIRLVVETRPTAWQQLPIIYVARRK